jgi:perosamine synthetase
VNLIVEDVVEAVRTALGHSGENDKPEPLHEVRLTPEDREAVGQCLDSGWVSTAGEAVSRFERELAELHNVDFCVATNTGSAALQLALLAVGVRRGDDVLIPPLSFVATANAVVHAGSSPHFVDIEEQSLGMDPDVLGRFLTKAARPTRGGTVNQETGRRIGAIVPVHIFGHPCRIDEIVDLAKRFEIPVVEDAAESLGSFWHGQAAGTFGEAGILSFNGNKIVTCGAGGAVLTDDATLANRVRVLSNNARTERDFGYFHDEVGFNFRMPALNASLGSSQLKRLTALTNSKRGLFQSYVQAFAELTEVCVFQEPDAARSNYWLQTLVLNKPWIEHRSAILTGLNQSRFESRSAWHLLSSLPPFAHAPRTDLQCAEDMVRRIINPPSSPHLGDSISTS